MWNVAWQIQNWKIKTKDMKGYSSHSFPQALQCAMKTEWLIKNGVIEKQKFRCNLRKHLKYCVKYLGVHSSFLPGTQWGCGNIIIGQVTVTHFISPEIHNAWNQEQIQANICEMNM